MLRYIVIGMYMETKICTLEYSSKKGLHRMQNGEWQWAITLAQRPTKTVTGYPGKNFAKKPWVFNMVFLGKFAPYNEQGRRVIVVEFQQFNFLTHKSARETMSASVAARCDYSLPI